MKGMKKKLGADNTCVAHAPTVYRAMVTGNPYPVRAMLTVASNPMVTMPNTKLVYKALKSHAQYHHPKILYSHKNVKAWILTIKSRFFVEHTSGIIDIFRLVTIQA